MEYNTAVVLAGGCLLGASSGLVGCFALLRGRALVGDALAHAALPGVCLAFILTGQRSLMPLLAGALGCGFLGVAAIAALRRWTRIKEDAAIGAVLSVFFGAGVVLSRIIQNMSISGSKAGLDAFILGKTAGLLLEDVYLIAGVSIVCLLTVAALYKEFKLVVFDTGFSRAQGWPAGVLDFSIMVLIALTVAIGLPSTGALLVAALLILPGAAARYWTNRFSRMLWISSGIGCLVGLAGTAASASISKLPAGPIIVLVGAGVFMLSLILAPERGVVGRLLAQRRLRLRLRDRQLLTAIWERVEHDLPTPRPLSLRTLAKHKRLSVDETRKLVKSAAVQGWVRLESNDTFVVLPAGWDEMCRVVQQVRLWDQFLAEHGDLASTLADLEDVSLADKVPENLLAHLTQQLKSQGRWPCPPAVQGATG